MGGEGGERGKEVRGWREAIEERRGYSIEGERAEEREGTKKIYLCRLQ